MGKWKTTPEERLKKRLESGEVTSDVASHYRFKDQTAKWIYTKIFGLDYVLFLHTGQNIPRSTERRQKRCAVIDKKDPVIYIIGAGEGGTALRKKYQLPILKEYLPEKLLNKKELSVLDLRARGHKRSQIAKRLSGGHRSVAINSASVRGLLYRIYKKLENHKIKVLRNGRYLKFYMQRRIEKQAK